MRVQQAATAWYVHVEDRQDGGEGVSLRGERSDARQAEEEVEHQGQEPRQLAGRYGRERIEGVHQR